MGTELDDIRKRLLALEASQMNQARRERDALEGIFEELKLLRRDLAHLRIDVEYDSRSDLGRRVTSSKFDAILDRLSDLVEGLTHSHREAGAGDGEDGTQAVFKEKVSGQPLPGSGAVRLPSQPIDKSVQTTTTMKTTSSSQMPAETLGGFGDRTFFRSLGNRQSGGDGVASTTATDPRDTVSPTTNGAVDGAVYDTPVLSSLAKSSSTSALPQSDPQISGIQDAPQHVPLPHPPANVSSSTPTPTQQPVAGPPIFSTGFTAREVFGLDRQRRSLPVRRAEPAQPRDVENPAATSNVQVSREEKYREPVKTEDSDED
ncbi:hypothetical protein PENSPDRAFT_659038 [Peniophora sp. CONT]|nr:hypothetical protein PENSPDRAFT_659038 [Peniophora sp. CONT]